MGRIRDFFHSLYDEVETDKPSFFESLYDTVPATEEKKQSFFDSLRTKEYSFTDSRDINSAFSGVTGKIKYYQRRLDMLSRAVSTVNNDEFPGAKEVKTEYLELALMFNQDLEPYATLSEDRLDPTAKYKIEMALAKFETEFNKRVPRVETLCWLSQMTVVNRAMKRLFDTGTLHEINPKTLYEYSEYIAKIAAKKEQFEAFRNELINELLIAEYRLTMLSLMQKVGNGEKVSKSPFLGADNNKISLFEKMFVEDAEKVSEQYALSKRYISRKLYSAKEIKRLETDADRFDESMDRLMLDDFSVSEIFLNDEEGFETLKTFARLKLSLNAIAADIRNKPHTKNKGQGDSER